MQPRWLILMIMISSVAWTLTPQVAQADSRLAPHVTQAEVEIWKQRTMAGPYLDEWNRILSRANNFRSNPTGTWPGNQLNVAWNGDDVRDGKQPPNSYPGGGGGNRTWGDEMRDAGLVYMITGDTSYRNPVRALLLKQAATAGTNFANATKWPSTYINMDKDFQIANWLRKVAYAYTYIRSSLSAGDRATIDAWFLNAATYWGKTVVHNTVRQRFPNWLNDNYSNPGNQGKTHFGGYDAYSFSRAWDNKMATYTAVAGIVGPMLGNAELISTAKRFVKEWIRYATYPNCTIYDQYRWNGASPQTGWLYAMTTIGTNITTADHIARTGDTELYTYTSSEGAYNTVGGPKSLLCISRRIANMALGNVIVYASTTSTTDSSKIIDASGPGGNLVYDVALAQANVHYKDKTLKSSYTRPMPSNPSSGGYDPWGGDWGNLPAARFMFGQMEGKVWPYTTAADLAAPTNIRLLPVE
jgi:hypothetical protein